MQGKELTLTTIGNFHCISMICLLAQIHLVMLNDIQWVNLWPFVIGITLEIITWDNCNLELLQENMLKEISSATCHYGSGAFIVFAKLLLHYFIYRYALHNIMFASVPCDLLYHCIQAVISKDHTHWIIGCLEE